MAGSFLNKKKSGIRESGFGMIEAIIGVALASIFMVAFATLMMQTVKLNRVNMSKLKAEIYLRELMEVATDLGQSDWSQINELPCYSVSGCHPEISGGKWILVYDDEQLDAGVFTRRINISDVYRDSSAFTRIVQFGGVNDPNTKKVTGTIVWNDGSHPQMSLEMYVYNYVP